MDTRQRQRCSDTSTEGHRKPEPSSIATSIRQGAEDAGRRIGTARAVPTISEGHRQSEPSSIAALIRQGAEDAGQRQGTTRAVTKVQRMINSLQWRQAHSKDEFYPIALESGDVLRLRQLQAGEVTGLGTGATVWPAAHVLAKYLELKFGSGGMNGYRVIDLGSGTGVAGIVAASLGAAEALLTDQEQLLFLMRENASRWERDTMDARVACERTTAAIKPLAAAPVARGVIHVMTYSWGMEDAHLSPPVDVVLVSDCVLPKLYPIEPLVAAIDRLSGPETVTIMSYEHRHYQDFDPRRKFEELAAARGLFKADIPQARQHPIFSADDIEIWEVRRRPEAAVAKPANPRHEPRAGQTSRDVMDSKQCYVVVRQQSRSLLEIQSESSRVQASVEMLGEIHELVQAPSGAIGCYLWPSAVVMARHLVAEDARTKSGGAEHEFPDSSPALLYPPRARVLELGSGVGLVALAAVLIGWDVVATDKEDALPLLQANVKKCLESTTRSPVGTVEVMQYVWGTDACHLNGRRNPGAKAGFDVVIGSDCVYAKTSVEPLLATLCQVCGDDTLVLIANELRSAFDEFLQLAKGHFEVENVPVSEDDMVIDNNSNERPKPVALKRLRRCQPSRKG